MPELTIEKRGHSRAPSWTRFGLCAALLTPFTASGAIDMERFTAHARALLDGGCRHVTPFGTTGEGASIGARERREVFAAFLAAGIAPRQIIAGVTECAVDEAAGRIAAALDAGIAHCLVAPPYYYRGVSVAGVHDWYDALLRRIGSEARVVLYHIPQVTGAPVTPETVARLAKRFGERVAAIKDSSGDWAGTERLIAQGVVPVLVGDERQLGRALEAGAGGSISGLTNYAPALMTALFRGEPVQARITTLADAILAHPVTPALKVLVARATSEPAWERVRAPLVPLDAQARARLLESCPTTP